MVACKLSHVTVNLFPRVRVRIRVGSGNVRVKVRFALGAS